MKSPFHVLWMIGCLAANLFHIYYISSIFFQYDVTTNVQLYFPDRIDTPSVLMCIDLYKMFSWDNFTLEEKKSLLTNKTTGKLIFKEVYKRFFKSMEEECKTKNVLSSSIECQSMTMFYIMESEIRDLYSNVHPINHRNLFRMTRRRDELVKLLTLDPVSNDYIGNSTEAGLVTEIELFRGENRSEKCFLLEHRGRLRSHGYVSIRNVHHLKIFEMYFPYKYNGHRYPWWKWRHIGDVRYSLSPPGYENFDMTEQAVLKIRNDGRYLVTYSDIRTRLLPPPYPTKCRDYVKEGLQTQRGCRRRCLRQLSLSMTGKLHPDNWIMYPDDVDFEVLSFKDSRKDYIESTCKHQCRQKECLTYLYLPRIMVREDLRSARQTHIDQLISMVPITQSETIERLVLIQYLTDVSSSLGFWLGLSALEFVQLVVSVAGRLMNVKMKGILEHKNDHQKSGEKIDLQKIKRETNTIKWFMTAMRQELDIFKRQLVTRDSSVIPS